MTYPSEEAITELLALAQAMTDELGRQHQEQVAEMRRSNAGLTTAVSRTVAQLQALEKAGQALAKGWTTVSRDNAHQLVEAAGAAGERMAQRQGKAFAEAATDQVQVAALHLQAATAEARTATGELRSARLGFFTNILIAGSVAVGLVGALGAGTWLYWGIQDKVDEVLRQPVAACAPLDKGEGRRPKAPRGTP